MTHAFHGRDWDMHIDGLADGCSRCRFQSEHPMETLDERMITALMERLESGLKGRSANEKRAMAGVWEAEHEAGAWYRSRA